MTIGAGRVEVVRVDDGHIGPLTEFYRAVWNPADTIEGARASRAAAAAVNPVSPGEPPPTWLVLQDGRAIAHITTIPFLLSSLGKEQPAYWMKGLWVLPEFQRSSAGFLVLRAAVSGLENAMFALVHEAAAIRLFEALKFTDMGELPNSVRVLRAGSLLAKLDVDTLGPGAVPRWIRPVARGATSVAHLIGPVVDGACGVISAIATGPLGRLSVTATPECDTGEIEALWRSVSNEFPAGSVRGGEQVSWRYAQGDDYSFVLVRSKARLVGLGVVRRPRRDGDARLRGVRLATLSDMVFRPGDSRAGLAVLLGAERAARNAGADALLCSATARSVQKLLRRRAYLPLPGNLHILARHPGGATDLPARLDDWWFTRGDSAADEVF